MAYEVDLHNMVMDKVEAELEMEVELLILKEDENNLAEMADWFYALVTAPSQSYYISCLNC